MAFEQGNYGLSSVPSYNRALTAQERGRRINCTDRLASAQHRGMLHGAGATERGESETTTEEG